MPFRGLRLQVVALVLIAIATLPPASGEKHLELRPLTDISSLRHPLRGWAAAGVLANVALFAPFGLAFALRGISGRRAILVGFCLSASIELVQLVIPGRTTSTDDVISNTIGCALGWLLVPALQRLRRYRMARSKPPGRVLEQHR